MTAHSDGTEGVRIRSGFNRVEQIRYSSTQNQRIEQDGIVGWMSLEGAVDDDVFRLLHVGTVIGLGKGTTMGLGQLALEVGGDAYAY